MQTAAQSTNDLGRSLLNNYANTLLNDYKYTSSSGPQALNFGDRVWNAIANKPIDQLHLASQTLA